MRFAFGKPAESPSFNPSPSQRPTAPLSVTVPLDLRPRTLQLHLAIVFARPASIPYRCGPGILHRIPCPCPEHDSRRNTSEQVRTESVVDHRLGNEHSTSAHVLLRENLDRRDSRNSPVSSIRVQCSSVQRLHRRSCRESQVRVQLWHNLGISTTWRSLLNL